MNSKKLNDKDIRFSFVQRNKDFFSAQNHVFVNEYGINGTNIVDLACFDFNKNIFYGFEIKSDKDNLSRLYKQLTSYITFFNFVYVVATERHLEEITKILDENEHLHKVGIISVDSSLNFQEIRRAKMYRPFYDLFVSNLDLEEVKLICESKGLPVFNRNKKTLISCMKMHVSFDEIYEGLHNKLRKLYIRHCHKCGSTLYYNKTVEGRLEHFCYLCNSVISDECSWDNSGVINQQIYKKH